MPSAETRPVLTPRKQIVALLEGALERSPADETELVWLEARHGRARLSGRRTETAERRQHDLVVRVVDHGRVGTHRTGGATPAELDRAVRAAVAQSRSREPLPGLLHLPGDEEAPPRLVGLRDKAVANLDADGIERLVGGLRRRSEEARVRWADARVAISSSRGVKRGVTVTAIELAVCAGRGPGQGMAVGAARGLDALAAEAIFERARERRARGDAGEWPREPSTAVLSPESTAALLEVLNHEAFTAAAYHAAGSLLRQHLGVQVFDAALDLRDDATDPAGLPFPFDLEGTAKRPVELVGRGVPRTPALDQRQAAALGLQPTAHAVGGADARAENLFLLPGEHSEESLLGLADGGIWVGRLDAVECFDPGRLQVRARLGGVRRIRDGRLAEALPDRPWETSLVRSLASIAGIGVTASSRLSGGGYLGGITTPSLAIRVPELAAPD